MSLENSLEDLPGLSGTPEGREVENMIQNDKPTADWMKARCSQEVDSFKAKGVFLIPIKVCLITTLYPCQFPVRLFRSRILRF